MLLALVDAGGAPLAPATIAARLDLRVDLVHEALGVLRARGLADRVTDADSGTYRFSPAEEMLFDGVDALAVAYEKNRSELMTELVEPSATRVRSLAIKRFADSFAINPRPRHDR